MINSFIALITNETFRTCPKSSESLFSCATLLCQCSVHSVPQIRRAMTSQLSRWKSGGRWLIAMQPSCLNYSRSLWANRKECELNCIKKFSSLFYRIRLLFCLFCVISCSCLKILYQTRRTGPNSNIVK